MHSMHNKQCKASPASRETWSEVCLRLSLYSIFYSIYNKSSAVAEMAAQCCTSRIFCFRVNVRTHFLSNLWKYRQTSYIAEK